MPKSPVSLRDLSTFGDVAAEDEPVLSYFLTTEAVTKIESNAVFLILGRKGSGKTALVRHFAEGTSGTSRAISLNGYPWTVHAQRVDKGASDVEAYVASWRYLIAVELAALLLCHPVPSASPSAKALRSFFSENYGGHAPQLADVLRPAKLKLSRLSFEPQVLGNKLGSVSLDRSDLGLGRELNAVTDSILAAVTSLAEELKIPRLILHFDELDQGLTVMDDSRKKMLIGLILAARGVRKELRASPVVINPAVYLRTDLWEEMEFSDKNKITQRHALSLEWDSDSLRSLVNARLGATLGAGTGWDEVVTPDLMRGSQAKWDHMLARTFLRPRDVIAFLNSALAEAKKRQDEPLVLVNEDIVSARDRYSNYLKQELDDEIVPHWKHWVDALQACSAMATITFEREQFVAEYTKRRSASNRVDPDEALRFLYNFSVIGYERRSGYGGTSWVFQYTSPEAGWDAAANRLKVHLGLKEYAKLREERAQA